MIRFLFAMVWLAFPLWAQTGDVTRGENEYVTCIVCHGKEGEGVTLLNAPALAGQEDWYLTRQLKNFKEGIRGSNPKDMLGMQMRLMAMLLADDQAIADVVAYIKTFKHKPAEPTLEGDPVKGKVLYSVCTTCHGQKAEGLLAMNAPNLALQQDWYMFRQLKNYKEGIRGKHPKDTYGMQMGPMVATLVDDQAIADVIAYIKSLESESSIQ